MASPSSSPTGGVSDADGAAAAAAAAAARQAQEQEQMQPPDAGAVAAADEEDEDNEEEEEELNPLPGMWMEGDSLAPPCQSDLEVVPEVVALAHVTAEDVLFDLGCGDGRVCIEAAKATGASAVGVEIEPRLIDQFRARLQRSTPPIREGQVEVLQGDLLEADLSRATVLYLYLLPEGIATLRPKLEECLSAAAAASSPDGSSKRPPFRIVCNTWGLPGRPPAAIRDVGAYNNVRLLLYTSEAPSEG